MHIDEIVVDGFGLLKDRHLEPSPGLTLIRGENEAGKSTLLAFIRAILFGFDPKSPPPLAGGRRGGWLVVTPAGGSPIRIERYGTTGGSGQIRLTDPDGNELSPDSLIRILQGVEKAVYRNIFAFGLSELTEFETLTGPAIADRIYGAGMGTGATSVVEVENSLEKLRSDIFVKRGRVPRMNALLAEIDELDGRLLVSNPPQEFRAAGDRRAALEIQLAELGAGAESIAVERRKLERLRDGWSSWLALGSARARLAELPVGNPAGPTYAADLLERLAEVERDLVRLGVRQTELEAEQNDARLARDAITIDEALLADRATAEALIGELGEARGDRARLVDQEHDLAERSGVVGEALRRLGPGWDEGRVAGVDDSLEAQGAISGPFRSSLDAATRDLDTARTAAVAAVQNQADARAELAAMAPGAPAPGSAAQADRHAAGDPARASRTASLTWLVVGLLGGLATGEAALLVGLGAALAAIGGLLAGFAVALLGPRLPVAGIDGAGLPAGSASATRVAEHRERARLLDERARLGHVRLAEALAAREQAVAAWDAWLTAHGLPGGLDRETAARVLDGVRAVRMGQVGLATTGARHAGTTARIDDFAARTGTFLAGLGRPSSDPIAGLEAVRRDLGATVTAATARSRGATDLERIESALNANEKSLAGAREELAGILVEGRAADGSALRAAVAAAARRSEVERAIQAAHGTLLAVSGPGDALATFEADLTAIGDVGLIQEDLAAVVERAKTVETSRATVLESLGAERETIVRIERSAESAELRQQRADRIAELRELAESWSVTSIALALLRRTRERYEREHRPEVLKAAEELLAEWTGGRYVRIVAPLGKQVQELGRSDGVIVPLGGLSTGTAQQLYLALRFGLVDHFARQAESLPVVMDDILVNFDPVRAERAARSIEDLATRHQVLYFTCHPGTPLNAATVIELPTLTRG